MAGSDAKSQPRNPNPTGELGVEIRSAKSEILNKFKIRNTNDRNEMTVTPAGLFRSFGFRNSDLFRVSKFGFRISRRKRMSSREVVVRRYHA
jgi:hypothetical protein